MTDPKDPDALTDDGRAPVLSEDQAEVPLDADDTDPPRRDSAPSR